MTKSLSAISSRPRVLYRDQMQHLVQVFIQPYSHNRPADLVIHSEVFSSSPGNVNLKWLCCLLGSAEDRVGGKVKAQPDCTLLRKM
jgi:hypothetical protein